MANTMGGDLRGGVQKVSIVSHVTGGIRRRESIHSREKKCRNYCDATII